MEAIIPNLEAPDRTVLLVVGSAYSGSTLFGMLMGTSPEVFNLGEACYLEHDYHDAKQCRCGAVLKDCPVWGPIIRASRESCDRPTLVFQNDTELRAPDRRRIGLGRRLLAHLGLPPSWIWGSAEVEDYRRRHLNFLATVFDTTGAKVIVDTSKNPERARILVKSKEFRFRTVLLRKSHAASLSSRRKRMRRRRPKRGAGFFLKENFVYPLYHFLDTAVRLPMMFPESFRLKLDSLVADPKSAEASLSHWVSHPIQFGLDDDGFLDTSDQHIFTGNIWASRSDSPSNVCLRR